MVVSSTSHPLESHGDEANDGTEDASLVAARTALHRAVITTRGNLGLGVLRLGVVGRVGPGRARGLWSRLGRHIRVAEVGGEVDTVLGGAGLGVESLR